MKRLLFLFLLLLPLAAYSAGVERISLLITVTNTPDTGDTLVINAASRYWTNASTVSTILTNLLGTNHSTTNLYDQIARFPYAGPLILQYASSNQIRLIAPLGGALAGSAAGGWASLTLSTQSGPSTYNALYPMENMVGETNRTNQGSSLVYGLGIYSTNAFPTNSTALSNHITKGASPRQHVAAPITLNGGFSGLMERVTNGYGTNTVLDSPKTTNLVNYGDAIRSEGSGGNSLQVGSNALAKGDFSTAIGNGAVSSNGSSTAIGRLASATNVNSTAVGEQSLAGGNAATAIGSLASASLDNGTAVGTVASAGSSGTAVGYGAVASGFQSLALGADSVASLNDDIAIGRGVIVAAGRATAIGSGAVASFTNSTALGYGATTTKTNQVVIGTSADTITSPGIFADNAHTNTTLTGTNRVSGSMAWTRFDLSTLANGNNISVPFGTNKFIRLSGTLSAAAAICGIVGGATSGGQNGQEVNVFNDTGFTVTFAQNTVDPVPANRIETSGGADIAIVNQAWVTLFYDTSDSRWKLKDSYPSTAIAGSSLIVNSINLSGGQPPNSLLQLDGSTNVTTTLLSSDFSLIGTNLSLDTNLTSQTIQATNGFYSGGNGVAGTLYLYSGLASAFVQAMILGGGNVIIGTNGFGNSVRGTTLLPDSDDTTIFGATAQRWKGAYLKDFARVDGSVRVSTNTETLRVFVTNNIAWGETVVSGVGGANTNFTLLADYGKTIINGFTNVSLRAIMGGADTLTYTFSITITNGSGSNRTLEFSAVTNAWHWSYAQGATAPTTLTNSDQIVITGELRNTNVTASYAYYPWP